MGPPGTVGPTVKFLESYQVHSCYCRSLLARSYLQVPGHHQGPTYASSEYVVGPTYDTNDRAPYYLLRSTWYQYLVDLGPTDPVVGLGPSAFNRVDLVYNPCLLESRVIITDAIQQRYCTLN